MAQAGLGLKNPVITRPVSVRRGGRALAFGAAAFGLALEEVSLSDNEFVHPTSADVSPSEALIHPILRNVILSMGVSFGSPADSESPVGFASPDRSGFAVVRRWRCTTKTKQ